MKIITLILLCAIPTISYAKDLWLFTPGISFGEITKESSFKSIQVVYGHTNVIYKKIDIGEGEYRKGIVIFPNESTKTVEILLNTKGNPTNVIINSNKTLWHTAEGITIGITLKELEKLNQKSFMLFGFAWDYSGTISDWQKGILSKYKNQLTIRLSPYPQKYSIELMGDKIISSSNKEMNELNPRIYQLDVSL